MIEFLQREDIDDERWNSLVALSRHESVYPYTWYLDACSENWAGLVMQDYACVMPVPFKKKLGLKYCYQPFYNQQLGVCAEKDPDTEIVRMFLHRLSGLFRLGEHAFNASNVLGDEPGYTVKDRTNYLLSLHAGYEDIYANYSENCRRNIRKSCQSDLRVTDKVSLEDLIELKRANETVKRPDAHYHFIRYLFGGLMEQGHVRVWGVYFNDVLCAATLFAFSRTRVIYLLSASDDLGKEQRAMFHLVDAFIRTYAGEKLYLDFEGSDISTVARFFAGFGAKPEIYQRVSFSRLPGVITKMKRYV